jgi:hypothetical protein
VPFANRDNAGEARGKIREAVLEDGARDKIMAFGGDGLLMVYVSQGPMAVDVLLDGGLALLFSHSMVEPCGALDHLAQYGAGLEFDVIADRC